MRSPAPEPFEQHRVGAVLAFDGVAAVARMPDEGVVARAHECQVVATVAVGRVVPARPQRPSPPSRSRRPYRRRRVVARVAVQGQPDQLGCQHHRRDPIVAPESVDRECVGRLPVTERSTRPRRPDTATTASPVRLIASSPLVPSTTT